ncbi:MAG: polysaccharide deacetylase family protein [bacterium]
MRRFSIVLLLVFLFPFLMSCDSQDSQGITPALPTPRSKPLLKPSSQRVVKGITKKRKVALTYDMEDYTENSDKLLQLFRLWNIKVTFFVQGGFVQRSPHELSVMIQDGHEIGNHSWSHPDLTKLSDVDIRSQVTKNEDEIFKKTGVSTKPLFRCPYGACTDHVRSVLFDLGYTEIFWTNDTNDWRVETTPQKLIKSVLDHLEPGMIVLMHNIGKYSVESTASLIKDIQDHGYEITTVSDVLQDE